ncbi:hypothetical protein KUA55_17640 [Enterococcus sp. ALS3]|uniref:Uncharacterized protein n=1 Tax=Enterococcus alishanensis TaxID=1303817 RepID=A0ABS6THM3_9ENTE|nr:hypothetical protein [Enterococcus alishanensis]MBV7392479.1 hypothetical protein [Enterococcus alishanensis]
MNIIREYEFGLISLEEFTELLRGSGQQLLIAEGEEALTYHLWVTSETTEQHNYFISPFAHNQE